MTMINVFMDDTRWTNQVYPGRDADWVLCRTVRDVIILLELGAVNNMSLDHDMGPGEPTGYDLLKHMESNNLWPKGTITVHSANPVGAENMRHLIDAHYARLAEPRFCRHGQDVTGECSECDTDWDMGTVT